MNKIYLQSKTKINQYYPISNQINELKKLNTPFEQMPYEKINLYKNALYNNKDYLNIHSHYQFQSIIDDFQNNNNLTDLERLISLISDKKYTNDIKNILSFLLVKNKPDIYFYEKIRSIKPKNKEKGLSIGRFIYLKLLPIIYQFGKINNYLDIGCGDGFRTKQIGKLLKADRIVGVDIPQWFKYNHKNMKNMEFVEIQENKPIELPNKFDLITCIHTLHHWKNIDIRIKDIVKLLNRDGIFVLVEHDAITANDHVLIDIEHGIYEVAMNENLNFYKDYYGRYFNFIELKMMFEKAGLTYISQSYFDGGNIKQKIKPTRTIIMIFMKKN